jgi:hypothetical protein
MAYAWNFKADHVEQGYRGGQFASAESTLIAAGPPRLTDAKSGGSKTVYPIGLLENFAVQQSKQLQRIFEIGSSRSYFVPGRVIGSLSLGRVFYYGPSLLRVIYAYYKNFLENPEQGGGPSSTVGTGPNERVNPYEALVDLNDISKQSMTPVHVSPGDGYFYVNLASDMFNQGTGLATYFKDTNQNLIGAMYLEDCYVQGHQMSISSGSVLIMEGVSMQFDRVVPIKVDTGT